MPALDKALLVCPTYNPGAGFKQWLLAYSAQDTRPAKAVLVDSSSDDGSLEHATEYGLIVKTIPTHTFNHGGTRQQAINDHQGYEYIIFLTQDAILAEGNSLTNLLAPFKDAKVGAVCGRQLPRASATLIEAHARIYNYPPKPNIRSISDKGQHGLKTAFLSNSFAAYRRAALMEAGGFPDNIIFGEDMYVAAKMLQAGYKIAYAADACVYHSHDYSIWQEMKRYFDMGVFHAREPWIRQELGNAEGEGVRFVTSELKYLMRHAFWKMPEAALRTVMKYTGFHLGLKERHIPLKIKRKISMSPDYFKTA